MIFWKQALATSSETHSTSPNVDSITVHSVLLFALHSSQMTLSLPLTVCYAQSACSFLLAPLLHTMQTTGGF